jgi:hypothetical protein
VEEKKNQLRYLKPLIDADYGWMINQTIKWAKIDTESLNLCV